MKIAHTGQREAPQPQQYSSSPQQGPKIAGHNHFSDCKRPLNEGAQASVTASSAAAAPVPTATYSGVSPLTAGLNFLSLASKVPASCAAPENAFTSLPYAALHTVPQAQLVKPKYYRLTVLNAGGGGLAILVLTKTLYFVYSKPPSPAVTEIVLQIVQMDAALTALMIPPGQCAFGLQPLPDETTNTEMTEPEKLFLRWWDTVEKLRGSLMLAFERVILEDLDFCNSAHVEQGMWKSVFYAVLESLRAWQNNPYLTALLPKPSGSETQKAVDHCGRLGQLIRQICVEQVIHAGERRLTSLLHRIQATRRVRLDYILADGRPPPETGSRTRRLVYLSAQKLMLFLGDLARYEELITGGQNYGKARSWYQKAQLLVPKNGRPYNQLAVLAVYTKFGCPERFTHMVCQLHDGMMARVMDNGTVSEAFAVINGMKQGCVPAAMLMCAYHDEYPAIRIAYGTDGYLLNSRRMQAPTGVSTTTVHVLLFADSFALNTVTEEDMQRNMDLFAADCANFRLTINIAKTPLSCNTRIDEVAHRISSASQDFGRLQASVWNRHGIHLSTKLKIYKAGSIAVTTSCHGAESFPSQLPAQNTEAEKQDRIPDTEFLEHTGILSIHAMLRQVQLRWSDHLVRMDGERLPKLFFYGDVATDARRQGGKKRRYKDTLLNFLKQLQIKPTTWEDLAQDRLAWKRSVKTGAAIYEANRIADAKAKRAARNTTTTAQTIYHNFIDAPPPTITDTIVPPPPLAPIMAANTTRPTLATSVATKYLPPAATATALSTGDGDSARHFDAMCYYMRTLAASNPFPTASQSLSALFNEIHVRAVDLMREHSSTSNWPGFGSQKQQTHVSAAAQISSMFSHSRPKRVEIWIHPLDRSVTIVQGNRSLTIPHSSVCGEGSTRRGREKSTSTPASRDEVIEDGNYEEEEEAQAEAEEYSNMSLIELSKRFGMHFMQAHGLLFTKIGMESFPEVASLALQALSGLLAQRPCPLSADRLCQILMVNMFNVDRAAAFTAQSTAAIAAAAAASAAAAAAAAAATSGPAGGENVRRRTSSSTVTATNTSGESKANEGKSTAGLRQRLDAETLRSVHHDHAARFALDTFSLICRRAAKLFSEPRPADAPAFWLAPDLRVLLPALRLWTEWMILHPEHWSPPPNHRDPTLRPFLDDCRLVAGLCTRAAQWLAAQSDRPAVAEITPTTQLVVQLHLQKLAAAAAASINAGENTGSVVGAAATAPASMPDPTVAGPEIEDDSLDGMSASLAAVAVETPSFPARAYPSKQQLQQQYTHLFEEVVFAGFKPMLDLVPKMYQYTGDFEPDRVSDFIRIEKIVLFGDFLCGIEPPLLSYNIEQRHYESVVERESGEGTARKQGRAVSSAAAATAESPRSSANSDDTPTTLVDAKPDVVTTTDNTDDSDIFGSETGTSDDIDALRRKRAALQSQFAEMQRLEAWRQQAVRQASAGGPRGVEIEVRPVYILPDTNCYIDWLEGVSSLAQTSSNYTVLVPIVVLNELDSLATQDRYQFNPASIESAFAQYLTSSPSTNSETSRASLIQERARAAIAYLETQFDRRNPRLRALTAKGSMLETIAYRHEANRGRQPGQNNDDVILTCCRQFCKEALAQMSAEGHIGPAGSADAKNLPMRLVREVVLLTSDRNLRLKALSLNIPARPLRSFVEWTGLPTPPLGSLSCTSGANLDPSPGCSTTVGGSKHTDHNRWDRRTTNK
ncbi:unnamed protein product [Schistocephalus solidus]|uniref:PIN domain-containing protein n=2 Tax=Schistocephalus solidus TaxID=70667 RepID=A0A3P7BGG3_SCHSO|nr:unnamed protein product [Schistocephalus solidus]